MSAAFSASTASAIAGSSRCRRARARRARAAATASPKNGAGALLWWWVRPTNASTTTTATLTHTHFGAAAAAGSSSRSLGSSSSSRRRWSLKCRAKGPGSGSSNFDESTRAFYRKMGVGADEDEFGESGSNGGFEMTNGSGTEAWIRDDEDEDEDEDDRKTRMFRDANTEQNNDATSRLVNLLKYILVIRCGTELPVRHFDIPQDAGVGGNVFSQFISSIVPSEVTSAAAAAGIPSGIPYFHVGIGPFIAASIATQVLVAVTPSLKELTKDAVGQQTVKQYTRYMMLVVAIVQSFLTASELRPYTTLTSHYYLQVVPMFVTGAVVVTWLADEVTSFGIGSGTSVMITMSVCGAYFSAAQYYVEAFLAAATPATVAPFVAGAVVLVAGAVLVQTGTCKVPLLYFQGPSIPGLPRVVRKEIDHIPFKINPVGTQPVLVAVFLCEGMNWLTKQLGCPAFIQTFVAFFFSSSSWVYYVTFFFIVFGFSYLDLQEVSEYMVKIGARIPNVRPGEKTVAYLGELQEGSRFFGGALLGCVAVCCTMLDNYMATTGVCIGFTSLLIVTSTILQMKRQVGQRPTNCTPYPFTPERFETAFEFLGKRLRANFDATSRRYCRVSALAQMPKLDNVMRSL